MGMYDTLFIDINMLPISDKLKTLLKDKSYNLFQTKSLRKSLDSFRISKNGMLWIHVLVKEYVEKPRTFNEDTGAYSNIVGQIKETEIGWELYEYDGIITFYTYYAINDNYSHWYEFDAHITNGKLRQIDVVEIPSGFIEKELKDIFN